MSSLSYSTKYLNSTVKCYKYNDADRCTSKIDEQSSKSLKNYFLMVEPHMIHLDWLVYTKVPLIFSTLCYTVEKCVLKNVGHVKKLVTREIYKITSSGMVYMVVTFIYSSTVWFCFLLCNRNTSGNIKFDFCSYLKAESSCYKDTQCNNYCISYNKYICKAVKGLFHSLS